MEIIINLLIKCLVENKLSSMFPLSPLNLPWYSDRTHIHDDLEAAELLGVLQPLLSAVYGRDVETEFLQRGAEALQHLRRRLKGHHRPQFATAEPRLRGRGEAGRTEVRLRVKSEDLAPVRARNGAAR